MVNAENHNWSTCRDSLIVSATDDKSLLTPSSGYNTEEGGIKTLRARGSVEEL